MEALSLGDCQIACLLELKHRDMRSLAIAENPRLEL
jgi:hypothetical protein